MSSAKTTGMSKKLITIICCVTTAYIVANLYIGLRLSQLLSPVSPVISPLLQTLITALSLAYPVGRLTNRYSPGSFGDRLIILGSYWLGGLFYMMLLLLLLDALISIERYAGLLPDYFQLNQPLAGWLIILLTVTAVSYGSLNARKCQVKKFTLAIEKLCQVNPLIIVCVSDLHLGLLVGHGRLKQLLTQVQQLKPDIVLLPGDILDETIGVFADSHMADEFRRLSVRFGTYACLGSHEYIWGSPDKAIYQLEQADIKILRDEYAVIADSFIVVGRDDVSRSRFREPRKDLSAILTGVNHALPIILLDHTPADLKAGSRCGVDLQLFGHTHGGQIFPLNLIIRTIFALDKGYLKNGSCHTLVSSGFGTWGTPLRIGSKAEILHITLKFK